MCHPSDLAFQVELLPFRSERSNHALRGFKDSCDFLRLWPIKVAVDVASCWMRVLIVSVVSVARNEE